MKVVDFTQYIGMKYNKLTILAVLPRTRGENGHITRPKVLCRCDCGKETKEDFYEVKRGKTKSCGHEPNSRRGQKHKQHTFVKSERCETSILTSRLHAKWYCKHTTETCLRSESVHLCCHECDKQAYCSDACLNEPTKCDARERETREE